MRGVGLGDEEEEVETAMKSKGMCYRCGQDGHWARACKGQSSSGSHFFIVTVAVLTRLMTDAG